MAYETNTLFAVNLGLALGSLLSAGQALATDLPVDVIAVTVRAFDQPKILPGHATLLY